MANPKHEAIIHEGLEHWHQWRAANRGIKPDLAGTLLRRADLFGADFRETNLTEADLSWSNLAGANLDWADLTGAVLIGADLREADLEATLTGAKLNEADLTRAAFGGADLTGAIVGNTTFGDNDLSGVKGLETVKHDGPSSIGIDTIYRSQGKMPDAFLRGCGVPGDFIVYAKSLATNPVEFYSCFISYSSKDNAFAEELHAKLQREKVRCWFAPEDLKIGDEFQERIEESIRLYDKLLVVLSKKSVASPWVEREVQAAFEKERKRRSIVLFPIRLDDAVMDCPRAWAADIRRTRHIGDFRKWKDPSSFQKSLDRLLRDLKSQDSKLK